jgi:Glyoxalase-like domain
MNECLDHIIWACDDLERGSRRFEALTGVTPQYGGTHASGLTHNALVSLGPRCYLEVLAPTGPPSPRDDGWTRLAHTAGAEPRILTYCLRSSRTLTEVAQIAEGLGAPKAQVLNNGRVTPNGVSLKWQWVAPAFERFGLAFPFFIDWLDSPHPAAVARTSGDIALEHFAVGHPHADELQRSLSQLGAPIETFTAAAGEFRVQLDTPRGTISL